MPEIVWKIIPVAALFLSGWSFWRTGVRDREEREVFLLRRAHAVKREMLNYKRMLIIMQQYYPTIARMVSAPGEWEWEACKRHYEQMQLIIDDVEEMRQGVEGLTATNLPPTHAHRMFWEDTQGRLEVQVKRAELLLEDVRAMYDAAVTALQKRGWEDRILMSPEPLRK